MKFKFGLKMSFYTFFKEIQESSSYIYASDKFNDFVCVNIYYVIHMTGGSQQIKFGETYAKSAKIGQTGLGNWIICFCQQNHKNWIIWFLKPEHLFFPDSAY
jgi:hypothetical protein